MEAPVFYKLQTSPPAPDPLILPQQTPHLQLSPIDVVIVKPDFDLEETIMQMEVPQGDNIEQSDKARYSTSQLRTASPFRNCMGLFIKCNVGNFRLEVYVIYTPVVVVAHALNCKS